MKLSAILKRVAVTMLVLAAVCVVVTACGNDNSEEQNVKTVYYDEKSGISYNLYELVKKVSDGKNDVMAEYKYAGVVSYSGESTNIVVPDKVIYNENEYPVTLVEAMAFSNVDGSKVDIVSVTLPESVTMIFDGAFEANTSLTTVSMPGVTTISASAFKDCTSLKYGGFTLPEKIEAIEARAFSGAFVLTEAEESRGEGFYSLNFPESLKKIGSDAFANCNAISDVTIGTALASWGSKAFSECYNISVMNIAADNPYMTSIDGVVYSKDMTVLLFYSPAKEAKTYEIPDSVKTLSGAAMQNTKYLEKIVIPDAITEIPDSFLYGSTALKSVEGGANVISVKNMAFSDCTALENIDFMENITSFSTRSFQNCISIKNIEINGSVTEIPDGCFSGCVLIERVSLNEGLKKIGISAFSGCMSLAEIDIPASVEEIETSAFSYCALLSSITLPEKITEVPVNCFFSDTKLEKVVFLGDVATIGDSAFKSCGSLKTVEFKSASHVSIGGGAFAYCALLENVSTSSDMSADITVTAVGDSAFSGCVRLTEIKLHLSSLIGSLAFSNCRSLKNVYLSVNPGSYSFRGCTSLESVTFSDAVTSISESAFSGCSSLSSVNFGRLLSSIGEKAFSGCTALERFDVASSNATFSSSDGVLFSDGGKTLSFYPCGKKDAVYTVPAGTTDIAENAFSGASFLEKVILSDDTVNLGSEAFTDCIALLEIEFGGITKISKKAFAGCTALREINITDEKIYQLGYGAFTDCTGLEKVTVGSNITSMNTVASVDTITFAFFGCNFEKLTFYTPAGSYFESQLLRIGGLNIVNY